MSKNERIIKRRVYSLLLESNKFSFLSIQYAFTLEEAIYLAKEEFKKESPQNKFLLNIETIKLSLYSSKTIEDLNSIVELQEAKYNSSVLDSKEVKSLSDDIDKMFDTLDKELTINEDKIGDQIATTKNALEGVKVEKNVLIKKIIDENNKELFEKNKAIFSANERKYIMKRLK